MNKQEQHLQKLFQAAVAADKRKPDQDGFSHPNRSNKARRKWARYFDAARRYSLKCGDIEWWAI